MIAAMKTTLSLTSFLLLIAAFSLTLSATAAENEATVRGGKKVVVERNRKAAKNEAFHVAPDAKIHVGENKSASLADLKIGTVIHIAYTEENGVRTAYRIADSVARPGSNGAVTIEPTRKGEKRLHAFLESVNPAANTFVVRARR
jgi:hypothetical protein